MSYTSKEDITSRMNDRFFSNVSNSNYQPRISETDDAGHYTQLKREQENTYFNAPRSNYPIQNMKNYKSSSINEYENEFNNIHNLNDPLWKSEKKKSSYRDKDLNDRLNHFEPISQVRAHPIKYDISNVDFKPIDTRQAYYKENT